VHDDPFETRERGIRRVHAVTASVAAAALVGTGAIVYELAAPASASTDQNTQTGTGDQQQPGSDDGRFDQQAPGDSGGTVQPPAQAPAPGGGFGGHHASSGGS
jgi:hypothetical protein